MLMFYKEDGSYDVKAFYEHRLIDEYQEGYGVGEDVGEARGLKRGQKIGMERGQKLGMERGQKIGMERGQKLGMERGQKLGMERGQKIGMERGQKIGMERGRMLERTNIIGSLSIKGLSNDEISNITSIPIEEVEKILNPDSIKLKRKIH